MQLLDVRSSGMMDCSTSGKPREFRKSREFREDRKASKQWKLRKADKLHKSGKSRESREFCKFEFFIARLPFFLIFSYKLYIKKHCLLKKAYGILPLNHMQNVL